LELSNPITREAASAPVTKKMPTRTIARMETAPAMALGSGRWWSRSKSAPSKEMVGFPSTILARPSVVSGVALASDWIWMAAPPKMPNQMTLTMLGTSRTPVTNWRMVRPRLMRAMNMPTNGVEETHQAQ
jgi:hypothetical protein